MPVEEPVVALPPSPPSLLDRVRPGTSRRGDFPLEATRVALLIVDVQDYLSSPSNLPAHPSAGDEYLHRTSLPPALRNVRRLLASFRAARTQLSGSIRTAGRRGRPEVIWTYLESLTDDRRDVSTDYKLSGSWANEIPTPSDPAEFLPDLIPAMGEEIRLPKTSCSVFCSTNLHYVLSNLGVGQLVVCGQLTNQCVEGAIRDAADLGYLLTVVDDACAAKSLEEHESGLRNMAGFARVMGAEEVVRELDRSAAASASTTAMNPPSAAGGAPHPNGGDGLESTTDSPSATSTQSSSTSWWSEGLRRVREQQSPPMRGPLSTGTGGTGGSGTTAALLLALHSAGVKFVRYAALDLTSGGAAASGAAMRCKDVPLTRLMRDRDCDPDGVVCIAEVCFGGLDGFSDVVVPGSGLSAARVLLARPDWASLRVLPFMPSTALVMCTLHDPQTPTLEPSPLCTRTLLRTVLDVAASSLRVGFTVGAELEFCLLRREEGEKGCKVPPVPVDWSLFGQATTLDERDGFVSDVTDMLHRAGVTVEQVHAESAGGQLEVVIGRRDDAVQLADDVVLAREIFPDQAGNGLHVHFSLRDLSSGDSNKNIFPSTSRPGEVSEMGRAFMEGILEHMPALVCFTMPSTNSFRRVGPGCWTGHCVGWAVEDKEAPLRVCLAPDGSGRATNFEYKVSDSMANINLALAAILTAGIQGIAKGSKLRPSIHNAGGEGAAESLPRSLAESLAKFCEDSSLKEVLGAQLSKCYVAVKNSELAVTSKMSLEEEVGLHLTKV